MRYPRKWIIGLFAIVVALSVTLGVVALQSGPPGAREASSTGGAGHSRAGLLESARRLVAGRRGPKRENAATTTTSMARHDVLPPAERTPAGHRVRELTAKRTANTRFYQLSNGTTQAEISATPVNYRTASGGWAPIDTTVRSSTQDGYAYANTSNTFTSRFGKSTRNLLSVRWGNRSLQLGLAGPDRAVTPVVTGSTVVYPGLADGADLEYQVTATALKETIVLPGRSAAAPSYAFTLRTAGLRTASGPDGTVIFESTDGQRVFTMPAPYMYDSAPDGKSPLHHPYTTRVSQVLAQRGSAATVTVTPDAAWLADPARRYPVTVDPTVQIVPVPTDSQDVQIYSGNATKNYNGSWPLSVGTDATSAYRSLVQFPLTGIPSGTKIDSAQLKMYYDQTQYAYGYDVPIEVRRVTSAWNESTATWAGMNAQYAEAAANIETVDDGDAGKTAATGSWPYSANGSLTPNAINGDYAYNNDTATGDTYTWTPKITEAGSYKVEVHYVEATDRSTAAPFTVTYNGGSANYTVNEYSATTTNGVWKTLGTQSFAAGTAGRIVAGDVSGKAVIADAVRLTKSGDTKKNAVSSVWNTFSVRNVVQSWLNGTANDGFMVKAVDEATLGHGGPMYEASEYAYQMGGYQDNQPRLIVTWGTPGVTPSTPTTITATGAQLNWPAYTGSDIAEYQVHRSPYQTFTPSAATLVSPVPTGTTSFLDTTATPTPADQGDPLLGNYYNYMIVVKTKSGALIPGPTVGVRLPKAGHVEQVIQGAVDTTLSQARPTENENVYDGDPYDVPGNNSTYFGVTRALVKFPNLSSIPAGAVVTDAQLKMWTTFDYGATTGTVDAHQLTRDFGQTTATWNNADTTVAWTTPGGDYNATVLGSETGITNDPEWESWTTTGAVKNWLATPSSNHGLLLKMHDETTASQRVTLLANEGAEPSLRPKLVVTYQQPIAEDTYYAPTTPSIRMIPGDQYTVPVTVSNPTTTTWNAADWELSYHWTLPDGTDVTNGGNQVFTALPANVPLGGAVDVNATVKTPINSDTGSKATQYILKWELHNKTTGAWLSSSGIGTLDQPVTVDDPTSDQLGLEKFYQYATVPTGAGGTAMVNAHAGNVAWGYNAFSNPGRGLTTSVRMTYNSLDTSNSAMGFGWSLSASTLTRLGSPLQFHPPGQTWPTEVRLTDGDGTTHLFELNKHNSTDTSLWDYDHPAGVHLYLQKVASTSDVTRSWVITSPDRTQFFFDADGFPSAIVDHTGNNTQTFTWAARKSNNAPTKFLQYITDPAGRQTLTLSYYAKGDAYSYIDDAGNVVNDTNLTNPKIIDQVKSITDVGGRAVTFTYTTKGLMARMVDGSGTGQAKTFNFAYDMTQGTKNVKLVKVTDPRGHDTSLAYYDPPGDPQFHWWVNTVTSRVGGVNTFAYTDPDGTSGSTIATAVTDADSNTSNVTTDGYGRPTASTNAKSQTTQLAWDADNNVTQVTENNGAVTKYTYDSNTGYPLTITDAEAVKNGWAPTTLAYNTGLNGHIADLATKTSSLGHQWAFGYDAVGNLTSVTDPDGTATTTAGDYTTGYTYDSYGQLLTVKDANGNTTGYSNYDPTGYPKKTTDALQKSSTAAYDAWGHTTSATDPLNKTATYTYDIFGRPLVSQVPKDQAAGVYITTPAPVYDANDNVTQATAPNGAVTTAVYDNGDRTTSVTAPPDSSTGPSRVSSYTYDKVGNLLTSTEPDGNLTTTPGDYVTTLAYDAIYEETSTTDAAGHKTSYTYDGVGNLATVTDPKTNASNPANATTSYGYDLDHRAVKVTDAANHAKSTTYDHDGLVVASADEDNNTTNYTLDARGDLLSQAVPHTTSGGTTVYNTTQYVYDQVGNTTQVVSPRGVATGSVATDFVTQTSYDALNRVASQTPAYDPNDSRYNTPNPTTYAYDADSRLIKASAPPSNGQTVRNDTTYTYWDNGWTKTSADPWNITTSYDYNELGQQTASTLTSDGGSSSRTLNWTYYPDGKLKTRSDDGIPVGLQVVLADNSDSQNTTSTGTWAPATAGSGYEGYNYATHAAGTGTNSYTWNLTIPQDGNYTVYVRYPGVSGAATNASYSVSYNGGSAASTVNQTTNTGTWVSLGKYAFSTTAAGQKITLSDNANGTLVADAVKLVRDNSADVDNEKKDFAFSYDANGNQTDVADHSPGALIDDYQVSYTGLNQVDTVTEQLAGATKHTTSFAYTANGDTATRTHDSTVATYEYDVRDLLSKVTDKESAGDPSPKVTAFTYTNGGQVATETKANGNVVTSGYFLDGALSQQVEKKSNGTLVSQHDFTYDPNGNTLTDAAKTMSADNHSAYVDETTTNTYDPQDRVATSNKSGDHATSESYIYDANNNVVSQTANNSTTTSSYDRNRLQSTSSGGFTSSYNYDPFGRLDTVTGASGLLAKYTYDGFDRISAEQNKAGTGLTTTTFVHDPFDRVVSQTAKAGTADAKTTSFQYLALSKAVATEQVNGTTTKTYTYSPWGERLSQVVHKSDGTEEPTYYSYNAHSDVEAITDANGDTKSTYGYTAYGQSDSAGTTGIDKPDTADPTKEPYNAYRFNADRFDPGSGTYDMGFRTYDPGINRFLTRDMYNGALADLNLVTNVFTGNRYAFAGGNPFSNIEIDGHGWLSTLGHAALDAAGMIPVVGAVADVANGVWYAAEGDYLDAGLSFAGAIPVIGDAAIGARYAIKGAKYTVEGIEATKDLVHGAEAVEDVAKEGRTAARADEDAQAIRQAQQARKAEEAQKLAAARKAEQEAAARRAAEARSEAQAEQRADQEASCLHSFAPTTPVLMADGSRKPIKDIKVGDRVASTDPVTGANHGEKVALLHRNHDTDMTDVTVRAPAGAGKGSGSPAKNAKQKDHATVLHTTTHHPFWDESSGGFVEAGSLRPGVSKLVEPDGTQVTVLGVRSWTGAGTDMRDLTVNDLHTYYVLAGTAAVLVHNCGGADLPEGYSPNITEEGLNHSFDRHAGQWFGGQPTRTANMGEWQANIERASQSRKVVPWSSGSTPTFAHLARIDNKWFVAQFDRTSSDLVTAFVPNNGQVGAMLSLLGK